MGYANPLLKQPAGQAMPALAYFFDPERLDPDDQKTYGRLIVARSPSGRVMAACWDCGTTRTCAKRWIQRGLTLEFVSRVSLDRLGGRGLRQVFSSKRPIGEVLSTATAQVALATF